MSRGGHVGWPLESKVYVGGLPNDTTTGELEDVFSRYGRLNKVWVARRPPGFAFIEFEDQRDAEDAVRALDGTRICGNRARVEMSSGRRRQGGFRDDYHKERRRDSPPPRYGRGRSITPPHHRRGDRSPYRGRGDHYSRSPPPGRRSNHYSPPPPPPVEHHYSNQPQKRYSSRSPPVGGSGRGRSRSFSPGGRRGGRRSPSASRSRSRSR